ncbi:molybdenum cofactor biosynthesis protein C [Chytriomyces sp. MP71]|nr:molybdenum cofactor biosynthesis protein C [Chytriomyces sp. MP71]
MFSRNALVRRANSTLSHIDASGKAAMVNVSHKAPKHRTARACATVRFSNAGVVDQVARNAAAKGDVIAVARLAAINAVKATSSLIPLAHPLNATHIGVDFQLDESNRSLKITCSAECVDRTGIEVEAMMGASMAAVTVFDMCKAADKAIVITDIKVLEKTGGKSDYKNVDQ